MTGVERSSSLLKAVSVAAVGIVGAVAVAGWFLGWTGGLWGPLW